VRVLTIVGNRPQFIKAAPLSLALSKAGIEEVALHTGQHYDSAMSRIFYDELALPRPSYSLDLRTADVDTLRRGVGEVVRQQLETDWVVVFGDTNTTLAGAQAGVEVGIAVAHVEAGLRSGDLAMPEERNRIEVDRIASLLLCPDDHSRRTLEREEVKGAKAVVGDVMADASRIFVPLARERFSGQTDSAPYLLATVHREANVEERRLSRIIEGLNRLGEPVRFPTHPRTAAAIARFGLTLGSHVRVMPPLGYFEFAALASKARVIVTDSGGLQKEAYWYGVPCVTLRPSTEWVDTVRVGANVLVDDDPDALVAAVTAARMPPKRPTLYGDGYASTRIVHALRHGGR